MSLAYRTSAVGGNTVSATSPTATLTPVVGDLFLVFCQAVGNTNASPTCSDGNTGGSYSLLWTALGNGSSSTLSCFVRTALLANTTSTVVTVACGAHTAVEISVVAISGATVAGSSAVSQFATQANQGSSTTPAPTFGSLTNPGDLILSVVGNLTNPANVTATLTGGGPIWTRAQNVGQTGCGLCFEYASSGFLGTTVTWGSTSASAFASGALEIQAPPTTIGVNTSKLLSTAVLTPPQGVVTSKLVSTAVLVPPTGVVVSKLISVAVLNAINTNPPVWPTFSMPNGYIGNLYSVSWDLYPSSPNTTYTVVSGSLPPGLSLNNVTLDQGSITGTPTTTGTYSFTLEATNTYGTSNDSFSIIISAPSVGPIPAAANLAGGVVGTAYSETITAQGGTTPYTFSVISGSLPTNTSLTGSTGVIAGTPSAAGTFTFTIQVEDVNGYTGTQGFQIIITTASGGGNYAVFA